MNPKVKLILNILSDGQYHSGTSLGKKLGLTRAGVWKIINQLDSYGIEMEAKTNLGYKIPGGLEILDKKVIGQYVNANHKNVFANTIVLDNVVSTNSYLVDHLTSSTKIPRICFAESQCDGKGRLGRSWFSPYGRNIYLSLLWQFAKVISELNGLSIVVAIAVVEALKKYGIEENIMLKWPNDIVWHKQKLAGVLIELYGETYDVYNAVIGLGLNVHIPQKMSKKIGQPWCDIFQITKTIPQRNKIAGLLLDKILDTLVDFQENGLNPFLKKWQKLDATYGKQVTIITPQQQKISGIGQGISDKGEFVLKDQTNKTHIFTVGEVSLTY